MSRLYESIKYTFTADEIRELGEALARETQMLMDLKEKKSALDAELSAQMKAGGQRVADLTTKICNGYELREAEVMVMLETPHPGMKRTIRADTGETLRDEPMTMAEMQGSFGFGEDPEKS
jgi:hypothetical protein